MINKWDKLKYFYEVGKDRSISKASERLNLSQTSLSKHIKDLEHTVGHPLFERETYGVRFTEKGQDLFFYVEKIQEEVEAANHIFFEDSELPEGKLKIITSPGVASSWLLDFLPSFVEKYPKINLKILGTYSGEIRSKIQGSDVMIVSKIKNREGLIQEYLTSFQMNLYASRNYINKYGVPENLEDLKHHKIIGYEIDTTNTHGNTNWFLKKGIKPFMVLDSALGLYTAAIKDMGIVELPDKYPLLKSGNLVRILSNIKSPDIDIYYVYLKQYQKLKRIVCFKHHIKEQIKTME